MRIPTEVIIPEAEEIVKFYTPGRGLFNSCKGVPAFAGTAPAKVGVKGGMDRAVGQASFLSFTVLACL